MIYLRADENEESTTPDRLILDGLELMPYQYIEEYDRDDRLIIRARFTLSKEQYSHLGGLPNVVTVIRRGIDEEPRKMELSEIAWSERGNEIKEQIFLCDKDEDNYPNPLLLLENAVSLTVKQSIIIDELLNALVSNSVISGEQAHEIKANATNERILEGERELNRIKDDLDEYHL